MYPNINAELGRLGWSKKYLSIKIGMRYTTLVDKLNGKYPLLLSEAIKIKSALGVSESLDYLFFLKSSTIFRIFNRKWGKTDEQ